MATHVQPVKSGHGLPPPKHRVHPTKMATLANLWSTVTSHAGSRHRLLVSPFLFTACWWFIAGMHFINGTLALIFAVLYLFFSLPSVFPTVAVVQVSLPLLKISGWTYVVFAVIHCFELFKMVRRSVRHKGLTFARPALSSRSTIQLRWATCQQWMWKPWNQLFGIEGVFGVNGDHFYAAFIAREVVEIALQSYQAEQLSALVRRAWITNLAVATIVINSISLPLVHILFRRKQESARRFVSLLVDMSLDFCCAAVIPMCVVYPYFTAYDRSIGSLPVALINNDVEFLASLGEIRQFCVTSIPDLFATMMPHSTVFTCLSLAKKLVQRERAGRKQLFSSRFSVSIVVVRDGGTDSSAITSASLPSKSRRTQTSEAYFDRLMSLFHVLVIAWGAFIFAVHIRARSSARDLHVAGCRLSLNAWNAQGAPCSVMQINCYRDQFQGSAVDITTVLHPLERNVLRKLIITHCPSLEIPTVLGEFNTLVDLDIYNSTLVSWPIEAGATTSRLRSLAVFTLAASPYVEFPRGLLHDNLPKSFARFVIVRSNLTELPDELGSLWSNHELDLFSVQSTNITRLPASFSDLTTRKIRLIDNPLLTAIQDNAITSTRLAQLYLSRTPVRSFPMLLGGTASLLAVLAEFTQIRSLSPQLQRWFDNKTGGLLGKPLTASLYGSPACTEEQTKDLALCANEHNSASGTYRWDLIVPQRTLDM